MAAGARRAPLATALTLAIALALAAAAAPRPAAAAAATQTAPLCASHNGAFVMLAGDKGAYRSVPGAAPEAKEGGVTPLAPEWRLVEGDPPEEKPKQPHNSFTGWWLQALPDEQQHFPPRGEPSSGREPLTHAAQLEGVAPYVGVSLRVAKDEGGMHTAFLRWTAGDTVGGGDSLYLVMVDSGGTVVPGPDTMRPAIEGIAEQAGRWAGCCYDLTTHVCACWEEKPGPDKCDANFWQPTDTAKGFGAKCPVGRGFMEPVRAPEWYEFAGQLEGDSQDFSSEPWDATCGAAADDTYDQGQDFAQWHLDGGAEYELRVYAREDGTALDAIYVAGPGAPVPGPTTIFDIGDSTLCGSSASSGSGGSLGVAFAVVVALAAAAGAGWAVWRAGGPAAAWDQVKARLNLGGTSGDAYQLSPGPDDRGLL